MQSNKRQRAQWEIVRHDKTSIKEFDENGIENVYNHEKLMEEKENFKYLCLRDNKNNKIYSVNLITGEISIDGARLEIGKEINGRVIKLSGLPCVDYKRGMIQFKESYPIDISVMNKPIATEAKNYNIGYKVDLPKGFCTFKRGIDSVEIVKIQVLLSLDSSSEIPCIAITCTARITQPDGSQMMFKF